jgi:hypothetical protein
MARRGKAVVLLLVLSISVLAGMPLHAEQKCHLPGMVDCCAVARQQARTPQISAARLCCALNCTLPGTQGPTATQSLPQFVADRPHQALMPTAAATQALISPPHSLMPDRLSHAPPAYIQHLALLI